MLYLLIIYMIFFFDYSDFKKEKNNNTINKKL